MFKHTNKISCGVDIGGTHISAALTQNDALLAETYRRLPVDPNADAVTLLDTWAGLITAVIGLAPKGQPVSTIGIAMPGPFDYINGVSMIRGLNKYESLYGLNIREALHGRIKSPNTICFENDAACFGLGQVHHKHRKIIAITLGTGFGACFIQDQQLLAQGPGVPPNGYLYNIPFQQGIAEDYISARWLLNAYPADNVREIADRAAKDPKAAATFTQFGKNLQQVITPWIKQFEADALIIGGSISKAYPLFEKELRLDIPVIVADNTEHSAITGAASLNNQPTPTPPARKSRQPQLPKRVEPQKNDVYDIYPFESLGNNRIFDGYESLARWIIQQKGARLDGYAGVDWNLVRARLIPALRGQGADVHWYETRAWQKPEEAIDALIKPFLGAEGSVWGTKTTLELADLYLEAFREWQPQSNQTITILAGAGAGLSKYSAPIIYFDLPKNEIQYRMRARSATNLAATTAAQYKRSYFVDWPLLNAHRRKIEPAIVVDAQHEDSPNWTHTRTLRQSLQSMAYNGIRARPWFEPGVWGGQWMKQHIPALPKEEINYAWSFELIAPENGLLFESDGLLLEIAFDWLMQYESKAVLGIDADRFREEFPIRFDFLDTFGGGNLSIQCHPSLNYIQKQFGENITQDETYYILDCKPGAGVYLGFHEDIDPTAFKNALEESQAANQAIDIEEYVQLLPAHKHDLFLIPNQTIHGSGINNLVLEISATPYIFTFKMYDWMRLDLDGMPRPINIEHAFHNLDFTRKGEAVKRELVSKPKLLKSDTQHDLELLPTHAEHFYSIHRITLKGTLSIGTEGRCHLLMLVEGKKLTLRTAQGNTYVLHYAETFVIPAAAGEYEVINDDHQPLQIIKAFVK
ncbi:MAG TPA: ROK family protein [Puia sp.]|uniref:ROK family protein n=1 Tax=Puia sp. TaxID=2045100 RepID=UPI002B692EFC|nr:ROK family protein [Puia sp.]HVU98675.1 ROK family protein [Puia sp.]